MYFCGTGAAETETSPVDVHYGLSERAIKRFVSSGIVISRATPYVLMEMFF